MTLTPTLVLKNGKPVAAIAVAGGDLQDQAAIQIILEMVDFGMSPEEAFSARGFPPRITPAPLGSRSRSLAAVGQLAVERTCAG